MPLVIRDACDEDIAAIVAIQERSPEAVPWPEAGYRLLLDQGRRLLVAQTNTVVGFLLYQELPEGEAEVLNLAVDPDNRRRGAAEALLRRMIADRNGGVLLEVRESNTAARALYAKLGFREDGRRPGYYHRPVEDAVLLRLG